jgi:hypothetical protein
VIVLAGLLVAVAVVVGAAAWAWHLIYTGLLDARDLAEKVAYRDVSSALRWPEMRIENVLAEPDDELVLVRVGWPAHPSQESLLLLRPAAATETSRLLGWCASRASVSTSWTGSSVEFRRRRSVERIHAVVLAETRG